jgi:Protein of unknown function (DUF2442)
MHKVAHVKLLADYRLDLTFDDGRAGIVDLSHLAGHGVFAAWTDYAIFKQVRIGAAGELVWNEQIDLCPDALYLQATQQQPADVFPALKREPACA